METPLEGNHTDIKAIKRKIMKSFKEYCEQRDQELEEGLGQWAGGMADKAVGMGAKALGRMGNAAVSGLGHGVMQGAQRGWGALTQGQGSNQTHNWGLMAQKAAASGDPQQFKAAANVVYKQMKQAQRGQQGAMMGNANAPQRSTAGGNARMQQAAPQSQRA